MPVEVGDARCAPAGPPRRELVGPLPDPRPSALLRTLGR